jgi:hypothetical protein
MTTNKERTEWELELLKRFERDVTITRKPKYGTDGVRPSGRVLVHNHIRHTATMPPGLHGFRIWYDFRDNPQHFKLLQKKSNYRPPKYIVCKCGWRPDLGTHYRIEGVGSPNYRVDTPETISKF